MIINKMITHIYDNQHIFIIVNKDNNHVKKKSRNENLIYISIILYSSLSFDYDLSIAANTRQHQIQINHKKEGHI